ncbi:MAG: divergent polysaccharide deacetylase family protein [Woeseiaceae bacterium]
MISGKGPLAAMLLLVVSVTAQAEQARVAIIIDDLGYRLDAGRRAIALPGPVAFAVLPGTPRAVTLARWAHEQGKEVLLHLPLQANSDDKDQEPIGIDLDMSRERLALTFERALSSVPHVIGVNGHKGSLLTRHPGHMQWLMEEIRARDNLFFVDSYTTAHSVALQMATEAGVSAVRRDVFLDPDPSPETVLRQFERMKLLARKRGLVVAIGHPYDATLELLEKELPKLAEQGIKLVSISELIGRPAAVERQVELASEFVEPLLPNAL